MCIMPFKRLHLKSNTLISMRPLLLRELFKIPSLDWLLEVSQSTLYTLKNDKCLSCCMNLILEAAIWNHIYKYCTYSNLVTKVLNKNDKNVMANLHDVEF